MTGELSVVVGEHADRPASWVQALEAEDNAKGAVTASTAGGKSSPSPAGKGTGGGAGAKPSLDTQQEGWYFASPLAGKGAAAAVEAAAAAGSAGSAAPSAPPAAEEKGGEAAPQEERWLVEGVTQHRYRLMSVVSRVVPVVKEDKKKKKATAAGGAAEGAAATEAEEPTVSTDNSG